MSFFKINSPESFDEYKFVGTRLEHYPFEVKILPDRNYIHDMLNNYELYWDDIDEQEFKSFIDQYLAE